LWMSHGVEPPARTNPGGSVRRGPGVRVRARSSHAERGVLRVEADSAAEALIFPPDGDRARV